MSIYFYRLKLESLLVKKKMSMNSHDSFFYLLIYCYISIIPAQLVLTFLLICFGYNN
uniref:Uncharacterized protein n=1 Tax=Solanum lycopersicum TaxID=4081 RepID=K4DA76_SOLLC